MTIAELKTFRKRYKLSQAALARVLHVDPHTVYMWEAGKRRIPPIVGTVEALMNVVASIQPSKHP